MMTFLKNLFKRLPPFNRYEEYIKWRETQLEELKNEFDKVCEYKDFLQSYLAELHKYYGYALLGHYYSPIPDLKLISENAVNIFGPPPRSLPSIDLRETEQLELIKELKQYYESFPFKHDPVPGYRFSLNNKSYSFSDAVFLYLMIMHLKPGKIIEVGCGHSSAEILDINEKKFDNAISCLLIEPFPELLLSLLRPGDDKNIRIIPGRLQDVPLSEFSALEENDILFIDSTHVSKVYSDVNRIFFDILPSLKSGVHIHFHDVFYPFEYPREWIERGQVWNESYLLRAFLQYNESFEIVLFNSMMELFYRDFFEKNMPLCLEGGGQSIWIKKR